MTLLCYATKGLDFIYGLKHFQHYNDNDYQLYSQKNAHSNIRKQMWKFAQTSPNLGERPEKLCSELITQLSISDEKIVFQL
ncbi:hypothetical protein B6A27_13085 [Anoxybacillus sp. UARK-01]|nr:hypothetical protein B6A27_13085 [Anoxybacillus sp. UARK-01]